MSKKQKIVLTICSLIFFLYCGGQDSKKSPFKKYNTKELLGSWKIVPSYNAKIVFDKDDRSFLFKENQKLEIFALEDVRGVRLQYRLEDDSPFAYFLFAEKTKNIWGGILDDKVVRIVREVERTESILE